MNRLAQWLLPLLLVVAITLGPSGRLDVNATLDIPAVVNSLIVLLACRQLYEMRGRYQRALGEGRATTDAAAEALAVLMARPAAARLAARVIGPGSGEARPATGHSGPLTLPPA